MDRMHLRRSWRSSVLAAGVVLATALSAAPAGAQAPVGAGGQPERGSVEAVPLSADLLITRTVVGRDGQRRVEQETNRLYRDSQGRTRAEDGSSVTISNPAARTTIVLDTKAGTFQRYLGGKSGPQSAAPRSDGTSAPDRQITSTPRPLGTKVISGIRAEGRTYTVTTAAHGRFPARQREVTMWSSRDVQLPVRTRVAEESGYVYEQTYTNIRVGGEPSAALFQIPAGYREADRTARPDRSTRATAAAANCPIDYYDPIVMFTFYPYPIYSPVPAVTDASQGCVFVADAAAWQYPLILVPETPLLLPVDVWGAYYLSDPVPWLPWTAFGSVGFAAASTEDATVVDTLIILDIF